MIIVVSITLLIAVFSGLIEGNGKDYTEYPVGTYNFSSTISCFNNTEILPNARIELWDFDRLSRNDLLAKVPIITPPSDPTFGYFVFQNVTAEDTYLDKTVELFYKLFDICHEGQSFKTPHVFQPNERKKFIVYSNHVEVYDKTFENH